MDTKIKAPRLKLKHALTATAYAWVQARGVWANYLRGVGVLPPKK